MIVHQVCEPAEALIGLGPVRPRLSCDAGIDPLGDDEVHIFWFDLDECHTWAWEHASCLDASECERRDAFVFQLHGRRFATCRTVLRHLLGHLCGCAPERVRLRYGAHGRPFLLEPSVPLDFNVSHSGRWAVIALSRSMTVGIDVETLESAGGAAADLAGVILTDTESGALRCGAHPGFLDFWTAKEACAKLSGWGLHIEFQAIAVDWRSERRGNAISNDPRQAPAVVTSLALGPLMTSTLATPRAPRALRSTRLAPSTDPMAPCFFDH